MLEFLSQTLFSRKKNVIPEGSPESKALCSELSKNLNISQCPKGGLPDDFWTILIHIPETISSYNVDQVRQTPLYQQLKREYEAKVEEQAVNTSVGSESQLQPDTISTSYRPL